MKSNTIKLNRSALILALSLLLLAGCGGGGSSGDGGSGGSSTPDSNACDVLGLVPKILTGTACEGRSPVVPVRIFSTDGGEGLCSGTVVNSTTVISAAHCFTEELRLVQVGTGSAAISVGTIFLHPEYREDDTLRAAFFDVAILKLRASTTLPSAALQLDTDPTPGEILSIFGYGYDDNQQLGQLRSGEMQVDSVTGNHIFTVYGSNGSNTCFGDSGGPAFITTAQGGVAIAGITSSGALTDCGRGDVSLFTKLSNPSVAAFVRERL